MSPNTRTRGNRYLEDGLFDDDDGDEDSVDDETCGGDDTTGDFECQVIQNVSTGPNPVEWKVVVTGDLAVIRFWRKGHPDDAVYFYIAEPEVDVTVDGMRKYFEVGRFESVKDFVKNEPKIIEDPVEFRLRMDAVLGSIPASFHTSEEN